MHLLNGLQDWWSQNVLWVVVHCQFKVIRVVLFTQVEMEKLYGGTFSYIHLRSDRKCRTMCPHTTSSFHFSHDDDDSLSILCQYLIYIERLPTRKTWQGNCLSLHGCILNCMGFYYPFNEIRGVASVVNKASLRLIHPPCTRADAIHTGPCVQTLHTLDAPSLRHYAPSSTYMYVLYM